MVSREDLDQGSSNDHMASFLKNRRRAATKQPMIFSTDLSLFPDGSFDIQGSVALLCWVASAAHAGGDYPRRDDAVDLAAELMLALVDDPA